MEEIRDSKEFEEWLARLEMQPLKAPAVAVLALRMALRVVPSLSEEWRVRRRDTERARTFTLLTFRAVSLSLALARSKSQTAPAGGAMPPSYELYVAADEVAAFAETAGMAAAYAHEACDAAFREDPFQRPDLALSSGKSAVLTAVASVPDADGPEQLWRALAFDCKAVEGLEWSASGLARLPLWPDGVPEAQGVASRRLFFALREDGQNWEVWEHWYGAVVEGAPTFGLPDDIARRFDDEFSSGSSGFWMRPAAMVNADVERMANAYGKPFWAPAAPTVAYDAKSGAEFTLDSEVEEVTESLGIERMRTQILATGPDPLEPGETAAAQKQDWASWSTALASAVALAGAGLIAYLMSASKFPQWLLDAIAVTKGGAAALPASANDRASVTDQVDCSLFAPPQVAPGRYVRLQVFFHDAGALDAARNRAVEVDTAAQLKDRKTLRCRIPPGTMLSIHVEAEGLRLKPPEFPVAWRGDPVSIDCRLLTPADGAGEQYPVDVVVLADGLPVGELGFVLDCRAGEGSADVEPGLQSDRASRYDKIFFSYSSKDRRDVTLVAQGYHFMDQEFFLDILNLSAGERWERQLYRKIDECDLFILFWSENARNSEWVKREVDYALERGKNDNVPRFLPFPLEGPPPPEPWSSISHLHIGNPIYYTMASARKDSVRTN